MGGGFRELAYNCFGRETDELTIDKVVRLLAKTYERKYLDKTKPYEGIEEVLNILNVNGYLLAVNSNKRDLYTKDLIHKFFSTINFVKIYGERRNSKKA